MKLKTLLLIFSSITLSLLTACNAAKTSESTAKSADLDFTKMIGKTPPKHVFEMEGYDIWCNQVIKGDDGKYHMFFSRWPHSRGHFAWVSHSEIAHAVSDNLLGPYQFSDVSLPARGSQYWDGECTHNPHIIKLGAKYYLFHTGNTGSGYWPKKPLSEPTKGGDPQWWVNRNNQRVGVAVAESPYGPWTRFDKPLIEPNSTEQMTATPTVSLRADGKLFMVFKAVTRDGTVKGGKVTHYMALADNPLGPWTRLDKPFIRNPKSNFPIDDHVEWYQDGKYYCIAKDNSARLFYEKDENKDPGPNAITEHGQSMILFESADGFDWKLSKNSLVQKFEINFSNGEHYEFLRFEMPKIYMEDGKAKALFLAALPKGYGKSFSVALALDYKKLEENKSE